MVMAICAQKKSIDVMNSILLLDEATSEHMKGNDNKAPRTTNANGTNDILRG